MNLQQAENSAESFLWAARRSFEPRSIGIGTTEWLLVPGVVCAAFSIELSLKAIIIRLGGTPARGRDGHDLVTLFGQIPPERQAAIVDRLRLEKSAFDQLLVNVTDAFEKWRYIYEQSYATIPHEFLCNFAEAAYLEMKRTDGT